MAITGPCGHRSIRVPPPRLRACIVKLEEAHAGPGALPRNTLLRDSPRIRRRRTRALVPCHALRCCGFLRTRRRTRALVPCCAVWCPASPSHRCGTFHNSRRCTRALVPCLADTSLRDSSHLKEAHTGPGALPRRHFAPALKL